LHRLLDRHDAGVLGQIGPLRTLRNKRVQVLVGPLQEVNRRPRLLVLVNNGLVNVLLHLQVVHVRLQVLVVLLVDLGRGVQVVVGRVLAAGSVVVLFFFLQFGHQGV